MTLFQHSTILIEPNSLVSYLESLVLHLSNAAQVCNDAVLYLKGVERNESGCDTSGATMKNSTPTSAKPTSFQVRSCVSIQIYCHKK